jgi:hypothetical protein
MLLSLKLSDKDSALLWSGLKRSGKLPFTVQAFSDVSGNIEVVGHLVEELEQPKQVPTLFHLERLKQFLCRVVCPAAPEQRDIQSSSVKASLWDEKIKP